MDTQAVGRFLVKAVFFTRCRERSTSKTIASYRRSGRLACMVSVLCLFCSSLASVVDAQGDDYFRATVPVKSQDSKERLKAYEQAFLDVVYRVSGFEAAASNPIVLQAAERANTYVEQYQYLPLDSDTLAAAGYTLRLSLKFSDVAIVKLLRETQQAMWANRPNSLVWLVEDSREEGKVLVNQQSASPVIEALAAAAQRRGLPLQYPVLDLDDQLALSAEDVWSVKEEAILKASERYGADVILVGRYSKTSRGQLWSVWQFFHAGTSRSYDSRINLTERDGERVLDEEAQTTLGNAALYPLVDFLVERYAIRPSLEAGGRLVVQLSGVKNFADYRRSLSYLEGLSAVSDVQIAAVRQDTMLLLLDSRADIDRLLKVFSLDRKLLLRNPSDNPGPVWQQAPRGTYENPLELGWSS